MDLAAFITAILLITPWSFAGSGSGDVLHVDDDAPAGGDGLTWDTPLRFLQDALALAASGGVSEIRVAQGLYLPDRDSAQPGGTGDRTDSFQLPDGISLRGGYAGYGEPDPDARDVSLHPTELSGDLQGDDGPDFQNYEDNSYHVTVGAGSDTLLVDGFIITGGNAVGSGGAGMRIIQSSIEIIACTFRANRVDADGGSEGGALSVNGSNEVILTECAFEQNLSTEQAAAALFSDCGLAHVRQTTFINNSARINACMDAEDITDLLFEDCTFSGNVGTVAAGVMACFSIGTFTAERCTFRDNTGMEAIGGIGMLGVGSCSFTDCSFISNSCNTYSAALGIGGAAYFRAVNCIFSRNIAGNGGGGLLLESVEIAEVINCTFSQNEPDAVNLTEMDEVFFTNSILWNNVPQQIAGDVPVVTYCDVQGGWSGEGNIDADPLFVQPGTDDLRLSFGSPCIDAGNNDAVPSEVETDLAGNPRIIDGIVDMGAYEGGHEGGLPAATATDIDEGEFVFLIPDGVQIDPLTNPMVMFRNVSGGDDASVTVTQIDAPIHPDAKGFSELGSVLRLETSLAEGDYLATIYLPFDLDDVADLELSDMEVTSFAESVGNWSLAIALNTVDSPGHSRRVGDRILHLEGGSWGSTLDVGDWGVFWEPSLQLGFTWGNVDYPGDFGFGAALCPPDARQPPDGSAGLGDLLTVIDAWGAGMGPFDVNRDGIVDFDDLLAVLDNWGLCP